MNPLKRIVKAILDFVPSYQRAARYHHWYNFVYQPVVEGHIESLEKVGGNRKYLMVTLPGIIRSLYKNGEAYPNVADILLFLQAYRYRLTPPKSIIRPWPNTDKDDVESFISKRFNGEFARHQPTVLWIMMKILGYEDKCAVTMIIESELFYLHSKRFDVLFGEYCDAMVFRYTDCDSGEVHYAVLDIEDRIVTMTAAQLRRFVAYLEWRNEDDKARRKNHIRQKYARLSAS